jgi:hypothetical protein
MRQIHNHPQPIHLAHQPSPGLTHPAPDRLRLAQRVLVQGGIGEAVAAVVG